MIENISINNYALIDHTHIELEKGFSVITGETGAGKSILLGAIGLTLGQRADSSAIMDKTKKCIVEIEYNIAGFLGILTAGDNGLCPVKKVVSSHQRKTIIVNPQNDIGIKSQQVHQIGILSGLTILQWLEFPVYVIDVVIPEIQ